VGAGFLVPSSWLDVLETKKQAQRNMYVSVYLLTGLDEPFTYLEGGGLPRALQVGDLVRVPLGRRTELGVVCGVGGGLPAGIEAGRVKNVIELVRAEAVLPGKLMDLGKWMHGYYAASMESVLETMVPASVRRGMKEKKRAFLRIGQCVTDDVMEGLQKRAPKQAKLLSFLKSQLEPCLKGTVLKRLGISPASCKGLVEKGWVEETSEREVRVAYGDDLTHHGEEVEGLAKMMNLTVEQAEAVAELSGFLKEGEFHIQLLQGVTGSGKTEVYLRAMQEVLESGGSVLFMIPEVSLAPQSVDRIRGRFRDIGAEVVVWHSFLSDGERVDSWERVASGAAKVVVGARSAVFAPLKDLRLIVVDEEHEPAYKQEEVPRYHGRDVAVYRAWLEGCLCILGSATPSLETVRNVRTGKYGILKLSKRIDDRSLPVMHVVDMTGEVAKANHMVAFSRMLGDKLRTRFEQGEQSIIFLNRRGYSKRMLCPDCGFVAFCDHCSVSMTFHRSDGQLRCHLCGLEKEAPECCPDCGSVKVKWKGVGTQRVEEALVHLLPHARVVRMDADVMGKKNLYRKILGDFRRGRIDVLVGTQMIAKGLDFPNVTLVGIVDADLSMHQQDFRSGERTFQLLVQVAGRAGRGDLAGEVVVQTFDPAAPPIQYARQANVEPFLDDELTMREEFGYPPFRCLVRQVFLGPNPDKVVFFAQHWVKRAREILGSDVEIRGPLPAPLEKVKDQYRFQVWFFYGRGKPVARQLYAMRKDFPMDKDVREYIDVDPVNLS
jgi:primosomal protein N' (replication factor Y)